MAILAEVALSVIVYQLTVSSYYQDYFFVGNLNVIHGYVALCQKIRTVHIALMPNAYR